MGKATPDIGMLLREKRRDRNFSIVYIAKWAKLTEKQLYDIERGARPPPKYHKLLSLGLILGISAHDLMWSAAKYYNELESDDYKTRKDS